MQLWWTDPFNLKNAYSSSERLPNFFSGFAITCQLYKGIEQDDFRHFGATYMCHKNLTRLLYFCSKSKNKDIQILKSHLSILANIFYNFSISIKNALDNKLFSYI